MHGRDLQSERRPFYFGSRRRPLFGCFHPSQSQSAKSSGVLLCAPFGQEYIRTHRACLQLAVRLSKVGFPVLRFDYYGCGDSGGAFDEGLPTNWVADIATATDELRRQSHLETVSLAGLRLGASLAATAASTRTDIDSLVLWDPIASGSAYVEELEAMHREMVAHSYVDVQNPLPGERLTEVLGFPYSETLRDDLARIDLLKLKSKLANRVLVVESDPAGNTETLRGHLSAIGVQIEHQQVPGDAIWLEEPYKGLVPHKLLQAVVSWVVRGNS